MIQFECPHCWTMLEVKNRKRPVKCPACSNIIRPEEMQKPDEDDEPWRRRPQGESPHRRKWTGRLWTVFGSCAFVSVVFVALALANPVHHVFPLWYGIGLVVVTGILVMVVSTIEEKLTPNDPNNAMAAGAGMAGGVAGVLLFFMFRHAGRWPQPLCMLLLAAGTIVAGVTLDREEAKPVAEEERAPSDRPRPNMLMEPPPLPFAKLKTPPAATTIPGLVGYWPFDEGAGAKAYDAVSSAEGTLRGGQWVPGVRGQALELNGSGEAFFPGAAPGLDIGKKAPFTLAIWVRTNDQNGTVVGFRSHPDGLALLWVWLEGGKPRTWLRHDGGVFTPPGTTSKTALRPGEWHHLAFLRHPDGSLQLFQDGASVDRQPGGGEATGALTTNARALGMEPMEDRNAGKHYYSGGLDEFCMFDRALTPAEVAKLAGRDR
jgi:hypothetical protein